MATPQTERERTSYDAATPAPAPGRFVWHDLMSTDPAASRAFHGALFGWTVTEMEMVGGMGMYTMLHAGAVDIGGIVPLDASHGIPSHWIGYCTVRDVDAACARIPELGGTVFCAPFDLPGVGRTAVVGDPAGAIISPFTFTGEQSPEPVGPAPMGTFCWDELLTSDVERATRFYTELLGWRSETMDMGATGTYHLFKRGDAFAAGMMRMPDDAAAPPFWLAYVAVPDADASARRIEELGGMLHVRPTDIPDVGRFAVAADPTGATFAVLQPAGE